MISLDENTEDGRLNLIYYYIGVALITWQSVEHEHFKLFFKLLGTRDLKKASIAYHSTESFEGRRKMVDRLISLAELGSDLNSRWCGHKGGIQKEIKDANDDRNKLAHYDILHNLSNETKLPDGGITFELGEKSLQPAPFNFVSKLQGWTADKAAYNLNVTAIWKFSIDWIILASSINDFQQRIPLPPGLEHAGLFFALPHGPQWLSLVSLETLRPSTPEPSVR